MKRLLALLIGCTCLEAKSIVTDDLLDKFAMIESNFNYNAVGDEGKALGAWQMHKDAWHDGCMWLANNTNQRSAWTYYSKEHKEKALEPEISRSVAFAYLKILEQQMRRDKVEVTPIKLYMAWNMGLSGAHQFYFTYDILTLPKSRRSILARANHILSR